MDTREPSSDAEDAEFEHDNYFSQPEAFGGPDERPNDETGDHGMLQRQMRTNSVHFFDDEVPSPYLNELSEPDERTDDISPDTEDNVRRLTDNVFRNFVADMYCFAQTTIPDTPDIPEITGARDNPLSPTAQVGRQLARIGDDINRMYAPQFSQLMRKLELRPDTAYRQFAGVARSVFSEGRLNWGRIITLLCFGYRIAVDVIARGFRGVYCTVVEFVTRFVNTELNIAGWIARQGGWGAVLRLVPGSFRSAGRRLMSVPSYVRRSPYLAAFVVAGAAVSLFAIYVFGRGGAGRS